MFALRKYAFGTLALISYVLTFVVIMRFFDSMNLANGAVMLCTWLLTIALCYLTDRAERQHSQHTALPNA